MDDPLPENIEGAKTVTHSVEHRVRWDYVVVAVVVFLVLLELGVIGGVGGDADESIPL